MRLKETQLYAAIIVLVVALSSMSSYLVAAAQQRDVSLEGTETNQLKTLVVTGVGWVSAKPDMAKVSLGVYTQAATATEAIQKNAEKMNRVIAVLKELGIPEKDIETQYFSLQPIYSKSDPPEVVGYGVNNNIIVNVHNLSIIGQVIDKSVEAGANQVQGVSFTLSEEKSKEIKLVALQKAAEDAKKKAETMASSLGIEIVGVQYVSEGGLWYEPYRVDVGYVKAPETPILPGDVQASATIQVTYLLK